MEAIKGGPGSGSFGHAGRPGKVGGSAPDGGAVEHSPAKTSKREQRATALGAARGSLRKLGKEPANEDANSALLVLDDLARVHPDTVAARWYKDASDADVERFRREWQKWAKQRRVDDETITSTRTDTPHSISPADEAALWAAGTQVADDAGEPLLVFHGTDAKAEFAEFRPGKLNRTMQFGFGIHFAADARFAKENYAKGTSGRVIPAYLKVNKLLRADEIYEEGTPEFALAATLAKRGRRPLISSRMENGRRGLYLQNVIDSVGPALAEQVIRQAGYDGVRYEAKVLSFDGPPGSGRIHGRAKSYVVFEPNQVRIVGAAGGRKGGQGSGNFGHAGRPGKVGGSAPGGGAAENLPKYLSAYRSRLPRPIRTKIQALAEDYARRTARDQNQEINDQNIHAEAEAIADYMSVGRDQYERWAKKIGLTLRDERDAQRYLSEDKDAERDALRQRLHVQDRNTLQGDNGWPISMVGYQETADETLVGRTAQEAARILVERGLPMPMLRDGAITAEDSQSTRTVKLGWGETHEALSSLANLCESEPFANQVARKRCRYVNIDPDPHGSTATAQESSIDVHQPVTRNVWLHELSHMSERYLTLEDLNVFDRGRQVSSYSWRNQFEAYAEWMTAYVSQGVPRERLQAWDPRKYAIVEWVYNQVLSGTPPEGETWV